MSDLIDPNDFVITRKRKKYKFAKFHNAPNCFELDDWTKRSVDIIEVGAGSALFSVELAARYPDKTVVALDVKADRLQQGAYAALERGIQNVQFVRARADQITEICQVRSVAQILVTSVSYTHLDVYKRQFVNSEPSVRCRFSRSFLCRVR